MLTNTMVWVLPPLSSSWIINIIGFYIALNRTPKIGCYWGGGGAVPKLWSYMPWRSILSAIAISNRPQHDTDNTFSLYSGTLCIRHLTGLVSIAARRTRLRRAAASSPTRWAHWYFQNLRPPLYCQALEF